MEMNKMYTMYVQNMKNASHKHNFKKIQTSVDILDFERSIRVYY